MAPVNRNIRAWKEGYRDPDGWNPGEIEPEPPYEGEGSQVPPPRGRDGQVIKRIASRALARLGVGTDAPEPPATVVEPVREVVKRVAARTKTAGEVRFIKDRGSDTKEWGWGTPGPTKREISSEYQFKVRHLKPLAKTLRATLAALGHAMSAYSTFSKIKSARISPDGALGGRGYIQKIADMRRQYMNSVEALSALSDTLYDEMQAEHWNPQSTETGPRERQEVKDIIEDVEAIREDPEAWAEEEEFTMDAER